ncbi:MAG: hypothetical protein IKU86_00290 [Thermoguttaceae bacterium]|nr:hypothetical protein [Thermoguttaceae bacterium]
MNEEKKERNEKERAGAQAEILGLVAALAKIIGDGETEAQDDENRYALATFNAAQRLVERIEIAAKRIN